MKTVDRTLPETVTATVEVPAVSVEDLARWDVDETIYVRPMPLEDGHALAVYAADGTFLEMVYSLGEVLVVAGDHDMTVATVH
ncbi:MAG: hypothetical protein H6907_20035 [Hyphomicrobiales bacterium]|nr:hypothetical protein [Hyphomicrobiales bacterium]MCP5374030.1 hypothetical protein [Hyphomicrobiales bacterium]